MDKKLVVKKDILYEGDKVVVVQIGHDIFKLLHHTTVKGPRELKDLFKTHSVKLLREKGEY